MERRQARVPREAFKSSRPSGDENFAAEGLEDVGSLTNKCLPKLTCRLGDDKLLTVEQQDGGRPCFDQRPPTLDDQLEDAVQVGFVADGTSDYARRLKRADHSLQCRPPTDLSAE